MKCSVCDKKTILGFDCSCGVYLCTKHRHPESHNCIDQEKKKRIYKEKIKKELMESAVEVAKVETI